MIVNSEQGTIIALRVRKSEGSPVVENQAQAKTQINFQGVRIFLRRESRTIKIRSTKETKVNSK